MTTQLLFLLTAFGTVADRPAQATAAFGRAQAALAEQRCDKAIQNLAEALQADPAFWEAHKARGECLMALKRPADALPHFQQWAELRPSDPSAKTMVAKATAEAGKGREQPPPAKAARGPVPRPSSPPSLGDIARTRGNPKPSEKGRVYTLASAGEGYEPPPIPEDASLTLLEAMEKRAEEVFRPRMEAAAPAVQQIRTLRRCYIDACWGKTTTQEVGAGPRQDLVWYQSQSAWSEQWRTVVTSRNEDMPACRALASDIDELVDSIAGALDGADDELARPPSVYPGVRERVFARLASELW